MTPPHRMRGSHLAAASVALAAVLAANPPSAAAQAPAASVSSGPTAPESVMGIPMGANRLALRGFLVARGWVLVADSIATTGAPSLYSGTLTGRPAELVAMFGQTSGRLVNLAINVPAASAEELRAAYTDLYRLLERTRCPATLPHDYAVQLDSILRGSVSELPVEGSVSTFNPLSPGHTTLTPIENTDWPHPIWANPGAQIGTQLLASRLATESRWPYQATLWSSVALMLQRPTRCADSRLAVDSLSQARRDARLTGSRARSSRGAPRLDSVVVMAGPGVTLRVDGLVVRGTEREPDGSLKMLRRPLGSTLRYDARVAPGYSSLKVIVSDTMAAAKGTVLLDTTSSILATAQPPLRAETRRLYELLRAELTSKNPLAAYATVECEIERLITVYPATASRWIDEVQARAHDPEKDEKAMRRFDAAMGGHFFGGCAEDRKRYPVSP